MFSILQEDILVGGPVQNIVIVGGGSAGWLSALHLRTLLGEGSDITVVESPDIPVIGVGEGTQPSLRRQLMMMGIDEDDLVRSCGGSYKIGIRFRGWLTGEDGDEYLHPFFSGKSSEQDSPTSGMHVWLRHRLEAGEGIGSLADIAWPEGGLIRDRKSPFAYQNGRRMQSPAANYALHVDAAKVGVYLRDLAVSRGVRHVSDTVTDVTLGENGFIREVVTSASGSFGGEIFIDCTGFSRALLSRLEGGTDFVDFGKWLLNDRAVTARIEHPDGLPTGIESATVSEALGHGWVWRVPLFERTGAGYVYSSSFVSDDDAEAEFRAYLDGLGVAYGETKRLSYRTGYLRKSWIGNCVGVGLSSGFIEPLEATGIALITESLRRLTTLWPGADMSTALQDRYNAALEASYLWVRDFIVMHYCYSRRRDTEYWRAVTSDGAISDGAREMYAFYSEHWPIGGSSAPRGYALPDESVACILSGMERLPARANAVITGLPVDRFSKMLADRQARNRAVRGACLDHGTFLERLRDGVASTHPTQRSASDMML